MSCNHVVGRGSKQEPDWSLDGRVIVSDGTSAGTVDNEIRTVPADGAGRLARSQQHQPRHRARRWAAGAVALAWLAAVCSTADVAAALPPSAAPEPQTTRLRLASSMGTDAEVTTSIGPTATTEWIVDDTLDGSSVAPNDESATSIEPPSSSTAGEDIAISTPGFPFGVAIAHGSVWVSSHRGSKLYRIDSLTNTVRTEIDVGFEACGTMLTTVDAVWVSAC